MTVAVPFYDKLLPLLGFDLQSRVSAVIESLEKCTFRRSVCDRVRFGPSEVNHKNV
jgi:hypothetical protein